MMSDGTQHPRPESLSPSPDWEALARYLAGESPQDEADRLDARFSAQPADKALMDSLAAITRQMAGHAPADLDVEAALSLVKARRSAADARPLKLDPAATQPWLARRVPFFAVAAAAIFVIGVAGFLSLRDRPVQQFTPSPARTVATGIGAIDSLRLPDGTRVVLGPLSSLRVAANYGVEQREVEARGDAYFDVVHDASKPFITRASGAIIRDIGTRFAVRTDAAEGVSVSVSQGSVSLQGVNTNGHSVVLRPGDRGSVLPNGQTVSRRGSAEDMAWMRGRLVFREAPLTEVIASLKRWYGIDLKVTDESLAGRHLTATFSGEPPERVLEVIRLVLGADMERRGDTVIVHPAKGSSRLK
jgi:transmembrane sensor